jgi:hypothetical protein
MMNIEYVHGEMNQEVNTISGHYVLYKEARLSFNDREILYIVGYAVIDNSCCGPGGFGFAVVPGFIISWRGKTNERGAHISECEPIRDQTTRREVSQLIQNTEIVNQIQFW